MNKCLEDLYEILNNLNDDLELDLKNREKGYKTYKESYKAIKTFTLQVLKRKIKQHKTKERNNRE